MYSFHSSHKFWITSTKKKNKKEEVEKIETDEEENTSEESRLDSPVGRGGDEVN
jgi:hypothetical protein